MLLDLARLSSRTTSSVIKLQVFTGYHLLAKGDTKAPLSVIAVGTTSSWLDVCCPLQLRTKTKTDQILNELPAQIDVLAFG